MDFKMHSLHDAFVEIQKYCKKQSIPKEACYNINLVCEELIVNLLKYTKATGYNLNLSAKAGSTVIHIRYRAEKFNPTKAPERKQESVEKMEYGGLGLVLVNSLASKTEYKYDEKQSLNVIKIIL
ncbi:hypothetical protein MNBD_BACTEROID07-1146 [hydrothermal vent metagenome]|uniref:Histidine kinase/HSP90-like ATPase domain-containing protein n=1 Tax=hydrothermal vent metagenome TaxID=652676 RepID=A0A3B0UC20_9ZZZZ